MRYLISAVLLLAACEKLDPEARFASVEYQVRCVDCEPRAPDERRHEITLLDGEEGYEVSCDAVQAGGKDVVTFRIAFDDPDAPSSAHRFEIQKAEYGGSGPGSQCEVIIREGRNRYIGDCSGSKPSEDVPCQLELETEGTQVIGSLFCANIPLEGAPTVTRHVVEPGTEDKPARFEVHGCVGL